MRDEMDEDTKTMLRLKNGDRAAFDELYTRFKIRIYNYVFRYLGNRYSSEDVTQEVFVRMYTSAKSYEPTARFSTWLFTIATNLAINEHHKTRHAELFDDNTVQDNTLSTEEHAVFGNMEQNLLKIIGNLPGNQRTALLLRSYEGMDYQEIAAVLQVSEKAVKSLLSRARENVSHEYKNAAM